MGSTDAPPGARGDSRARGTRRLLIIPAAGLAALAIALVLVIGSGFVPRAEGPGQALATASPQAAGGPPASLGLEALAPVPSASPSARPATTAAPTPGPNLDPSEVYGPPAPVVNSGLRPSARLAAELKRTVNAARKRYALPGVSVAILWPDGRLWMGAAGYADLEAGRGVTAETEFSIGSITKTFTAALILQLAEDGVLSLDDPVSKWVPSLPAGPAPGTAQPGATVTAPASLLGPGITLRRLLDHTSGLDDFFGSGALDNALRRPKTRAWTPMEVLRYAGPPRTSPGTAWYYSNTNFVLLGLVAERATGKPLAELYRERFDEPFGLRSTHLQGYEPPVGPISHGYDFYSLAPAAVPIDWSDGTSVMPFTAVATAAWAAGGLASTAADLARWARALYGGSALSRASLQAMESVAEAQRLKADLPYGYGLQRLALGRFATLGHSGRLGGYRSAMRYLPDQGVAVVVLTNQDRWDPDRIVHELLDTAMPANPGPARVRI